MVDRVIHAVDVGKPTGKYWTETYSCVNKPFNILISYAYVRKVCETIREAVELVKNYRDLIGRKSKLFIDSGVYTYKVECGLPPHGTSNLDNRDRQIKQGLKRLDEFKEYVTTYAQFLSRTGDLWDYAFDFDADDFLPVNIVDKLHKDIIKYVPRKRIIRVYHVSRPNINTWWTNMCKDERYKYLGIEGGSLHGGNPNFYNPLIEKAHNNANRVHILAITNPTFLRYVAADTVDSSTHLVGAKFGTVLTPYGKVNMGEKKNKFSYSVQTKGIQQRLTQYWESIGLSVEILQKSSYKRALANLLFMEENYDITFCGNKEKMLRLF